VDLGLKGRRAIVTGGSKGIGRRCADILADEGAAVAICARDAAEVAEAVEALRARGVEAHGEALDVADKEALEGWVASAAAALGGIDIVVANVSALAGQNTEEAWHSQFRVDIMHTVRTVNAAMPHLERSDAGSIVVVSSVSGREVDLFAGSYGATKAALIHSAHGLAVQLAPKMIRANSVSPGNTYFKGGVWHRIEEGDPALFKQALALNPTGRMATAEEVARGVVFLASPASSFTTGTNLVIDGALTRGVQF
jgi:NAD(P)-dependent dehydrogenase (short-subunit alcohol dehydrogenase family)